MTIRSKTVSGTEPHQRQLNGPQATGRDYVNLSSPDHTSICDTDVAAPVRDGTRLLVDVHRPDAPGAFPALIAASPYPRQIQDLGAPMGFIEAGASDFFVPRGYVHVIANLRGTGGSDGTFGLFDETERRDLHDLVEWVAAQPWCDGNVGMIGISYFAMSQLEAATQRPPHLKAIFPVAVTADLYEAVHHHGLFCSSFISPFFSMLGITSAHGDDLWRGHLANIARDVLAQPRVHERFATMNGEESVTLMAKAARIHHEPHPWDDLWREAVVEHPVRDEWWDARNLLPLLGEIDIPVYLGCDWGNVPLHLPGTFSTLDALTSSPHVRVALLGEFGLTWPWESLHVEALAWFDHWLKGRDTGILDGPPVRYRLPGADGWRTASSWPPPGAARREWHLSADGSLAAEPGPAGTRQFMTLGPGLNRSEPSAADPPASLTWTSDVLTQPIDVAGDIELVLDAVTTAADAGWIATLQDVGPDGRVDDVTSGWLRATLRDLDGGASRPGRPVLPCRTAIAVPIGEPVRYQIPLVANARRFDAGHRIRLHVSGDDQPADEPAIMAFRHAPVGTTSVRTVAGTSHLLLPTLAVTADPS